MKLHLIFLLAASALLTGFLAAAARAQQPNDGSADLTTLSGQTYRAARINAVEPDGITYFFAGGVVKVPFDDLPEEVRKNFSYNPQKAAAFSASDTKAQQQAFAIHQSVYEAQQKAKLQQQVAAAENQAKKEAERKKKEDAQKKAKR